ncbi:MAG: acylglycerol kinase family protein, partial [Anaerolineales bacterium]|nr:acylglycerol kinase family protein [Anaerolineales bacterium]
MTGSPHLIILNPAAGRGAAGQAAPIIARRLAELGLAFDLVQTERPGHAQELARRAGADGYQVVAAAGGDGTVNEVLNGLLEARPDGQPPAAGPAL